jgi:DNA repair exonuclease SbcCD ATPase subunit
MKPRGQAVIGDGFDGFDRNVAEKMPKIRKEEESPPSALEEEAQTLHEVSREIKPPGKPAERKPIFTPQPKEEEGKENLEVLKLIEDLHAQLLASNRTKRALEMDLASSQKTIQQLAQENQILGIQIEGLKKELQRFREIQSELAYLEEENEDALEKIAAMQGGMKVLKESLANAARERDQALDQIQLLEAKIEQNDLLRMKGRLKEREVSQFSAENQELRARWEQALAQNIDLEKKYETLRKSFNEVKESLTLLRDACKTNYYNLSETPEQES